MPHASVDDLRDLFLALVRIPSPSGSERAVADRVLADLREAGLEPSEDESANVTGAGAGNIFVAVPGRGQGTAIMFGAHLDTVAVAGSIDPVVENGVVRSAGDTILGADDKAAVTALLALLRDLAVDPPACRVECIFSVSEEIGLRGAGAFDLGLSQAVAGFEFDSEGAPGRIVTRAPSLKMVEAEFRGVAAHAGIAPENGRSAIVAAARAVATMTLGRIDEETTANMGVINGGGATNVVPDRCVIKGEARSRDEGKLAAQVEAMLEAIGTAAAEVGIDVQMTVNEEFHGFVLDERALPVRIAQAAMRNLGLDPVLVGSGGGSDVNIFNRKGLPSVNLSVGYENVHSPAESMSLDRLHTLYLVAHELVRTAAATTA
jgi:tripeptide aminopeptidase